MAARRDAAYMGWLGSIQSRSLVGDQPAAWRVGAGDGDGSGNGCCWRGDASGSLIHRRMHMGKQGAGSPAAMPRPAGYVGVAGRDRD